MSQYFSKTVTIIILFIFLNISVYSQQFAAPAETRKGWGYVRPDSTWLIEPMFSDYWRGNAFQFNSDDQPRVMGDYHEGMLRVRMQGDWGYYDSNGKQTIKPQFTSARNFIEGVAAVKVINKWGFINKNGLWVIQPQYDDVQSFSNGLAAVLFDGKWGYISQTGRIVIPFTYRHAKKFTEGFAAVEIENNKWAYIDTANKKLTESMYSNAFPFNDGMARVIQSGRDGFIDNTGKLIVHCIYEIVSSFSEGGARAKNITWFLLNKQGYLITTKTFLNAGQFHDGVCKVRTSEGWGYINLDGSWAIEPTSQFQGAGDFNHGIGRMRIGRVWKFIDKKGNVLFPNLDFDRAENFSLGFARINNHEGWGAINDSGQIVARPQYKHMYPFIDIKSGVDNDEQSQEPKED